MGTPPTDDAFTEPHLETSALLVIDTQADFLDDGAAAVAGTSAVLPELARPVAAYRAAGRPVVHVVRLYDGDDVDLVRRAAVRAGAPVVRPGSAGARVAGERDYRVVVVPDATSQVTPERLADAEALGVRALSAAEVARGVGQAAAAGRGC